MSCHTRRDHPYGEDLISNVFLGVSTPTYIAVISNASLKVRIILLAFTLVGLLSTTRSLALENASDTDRFSLRQLAREEQVTVSVRPLYPSPAHNDQSNESQTQLVACNAYDFAQASVPFFGQGIQSGPELFSLPQISSFSAHTSPPRHGTFLCVLLRVTITPNAP